MHRYNEGRKSVNHYTVPDYTLPTELVSCATVLGYKGREEFLPAWEYLRYVLEEKGLSEFVDHDKPESTIRHLVASTLALVQGIIEIDDSNNANQVRELQLRQILKALGIDGRGLSRSKNDKIKSMIRRAMNELNGGDSSRWNQDEIVRIAESIVRGVK